MGIEGNFNPNRNPNMTTYHIAKQYRPQAGNQYYKDRSSRFQGTFCGSTDLTNLAKWTWKVAPWVDEKGNEWVPCPVCSSLLADFKRSRKSAAPSKRSLRWVETVAKSTLQSVMADDNPDLTDTEADEVSKAIDWIGRAADGAKS
jgi:hypothetical protein